MPSSARLVRFRARISPRTGRPHHPSARECAFGLLACTTLTVSGSWLYRLNLAVDGNFRLKRKNVSTDHVDPDLNHGCAYFVEEQAYKTHLATFDKDMPKEAGEKHCNTHDAVKLANLKGAAGLAATGIVTVDCSRHDMKRPCSIGDLQKGERYVKSILCAESSDAPAPQTSQHGLFTQLQPLAECPAQGLGIVRHCL